MKRKWQKDDQVVFILLMPAKKIMANPKVKADSGRVTLQRGPLVYCLEGIDQPGGKVFPFALPDTALIVPHYQHDLMGGIITLQMPGTLRPAYNENQMTMNDNQITSNNHLITESGPHLTAIPYSYWANRGPGEMEVWIPVRSE